MSDSWYAVILAGGKGERFWPLSTSSRPKQLLDLIGDRSLLAQAVERLDGLIPPERIFILTNQDLVEASRASVPEVPADNIIGEPIGRDTAAAVALGTALVKARNPEASFCVLTADHVIGDLELFQTTLREGLSLAAAQPFLITIGITPKEPSTGYGYIESGAAYETREGIEFSRAKRFVEKPDRATAENYLAAGTFTWNSGMFIWSVTSITQAFREFRPPLAALIDGLAPVAFTPGFTDALGRQFAGLEKISIDYAVMEKADNILVAKGIFSWDDVGSWTALEHHFPQDGAANTRIGTCEDLDASGNIIYSKGHLTAVIGVKNLIVVQSEGVTLICPKDRAQEIKQMVTALRAHGGYEQVL